MIYNNLRDIKTALNWKKLGTISVGSSIKLPEKWNEVVFEWYSGSDNDIWNGNGTLCNISSRRLHSFGTLPSNGSTSIGGIYVTLSDTLFTFTKVLLNGQSNNSGEMNVFVR